MKNYVNKLFVHSTLIVQICLDKLHPSISAPCAFPNDFTLCNDQSHHAQRHMILELYFLLTTKIQPTFDPTGKVDAVELIRCSTSHHLDDCFWLISSRVFFSIRKLTTTSLISSLSAFPPRAPQTFYIYLFLILTFIVLPKPQT